MSSKTFFIDEVYNGYRDEDFSYGEDNLNPKREIKVSFKEDKIISLVTARIEELENQIKEIINIEETLPITKSLLGNGVLKGLTEAEQIAIGNAGSLNSLLDVGTDPISKQIENLIASLPDTTIPNSSIKLTDVFKAISEIDCTGYSTPTTNVGTIISDIINTDRDSIDYGEDTIETLERNSSNDLTSVNSSMGCILRELHILKIILFVIKIINLIKKIIDKVLSLVYPIVDLVALCAGCVFNPGNVPLISQKITQKLISLGFSILGMLLSLIWDLLNLDCFSSMSLDLLNQIKAALSGINQMAFTLDEKAFEAFGDELYNKAVQPFKDLSEDINKQKTERKEEIKQEYLSLQIKNSSMPPYVEDFTGEMTKECKKAFMDIKTEQGWQDFSSGFNQDYWKELGYGIIPNEMISTINSSIKLGLDIKESIDEIDDLVKTNKSSRANDIVKSASESNLEDIEIID